MSEYHELRFNTFFTSYLQALIIETLEEWEQKIEERDQEIRMAFFEYAWDNELSVFNTPHYLQNKHYFMILFLKIRYRGLDRILCYGNG
jgi:hypothetical protein